MGDTICQAATMQTALHEIDNEEVSGIYKITPEGPVTREGLHNWLPSLTRRGRFAGYLESALVTAAVLGIMGFTAFLAVAQYDVVKSSHPAHFIQP